VKVFHVSSPARTVKMAAKALNNCPQRRPAGEHAPTHSWRHRSRQLKHSSPMYMSSMVTDSHIMAEDQSETDRETAGQRETDRQRERQRETIRREEQVFRLGPDRYRFLSADADADYFQRKITITSAD
jgi:hypothetical protein